MKKKTERRNFNRFKVKNGAYVLLRLENNEVCGKILDMSEGGLTFHYHNSKECTYKEYSLDIFTADETFYLKNIPFKMITDLEIENGIPYSALKKRRLGIQFGKLSKDQKIKINKFIKNQSTNSNQTKKI